MIMTLSVQILPETLSNYTLSLDTSMSCYPLKHLTMMNCGFGDHTASYVGELLSSGQLSCLESLNVSMNNISKVGAEAILSPFMKVCAPALRDINMSLNNISNEGLAILANLVNQGKLDFLEASTFY